jgi:group I intron endonuclease
MTVLYAIKNIKSGKAYIGSTVGFKARVTTHRRMLSRGKHHCGHLQQAWNKYGEHSFVFVQIGQASNQAEVRRLEQDFLELFFGNGLYNSKCSAIGMPSGDSHPSKSPDWHMKRILKTKTKEQRKEIFGKNSKGLKRDHDTYSAGAKKQWANPEQRAKKMEAMRGKREVVTCPHCGVEGGGGNMRRYHFDRCKNANI